MDVVSAAGRERAIANRIYAFLVRYRFPILSALGLRLAASSWLAIVWLVLDPYFPRTAKAFQETYNHLPYHSSLLVRMFLDVWLRWDAVHYMNLAWGGYESAGAADMNFWPLYPYLVRAISFITSGDITFTGLLVSTFSTLCAAVIFWELVRSMFADQRLANWSVLAWVIFPTSFFLVAPFTDALYACLALASLLMMQRKHWELAGLLAALGGLARSQGLLLIAPLFLAILYDWLATRKRPGFGAIVGLALSPLGFIAFMLWRWHRDLPDIFTSFNTYTHADIVDPFSGLFLAARQLVQTPDILMATEFLSIILFLTIQIWMLTKPIFRKAYPLMAYGLLNILFNLTKHITNATPLQSSNRYVLNVIPAFIGFAWLLLLLPEKTRRIIVAACITLAMISTALYAMWIFVG